MDKVEQFWQACLAACPDETGGQAQHVAEQFGDNPRLAGELGRLVLQGVKTATCSALGEWQAEGSPAPRVGQKSIVLDGQGEPLRLIETTEVTVRPLYRRSRDQG